MHQTSIAKAQLVFAVVMMLPALGHCIFKGRHERPSLVPKTYAYA
jgi:hypothetical protein